MDDLNSLFTFASIASLQGATAASILIANALGILFGENFDRYRKWVAFVSSLGLAYFVAALASEAGAGKWLLALLNGLLVFTAAMGINNQLPALRKGQQQPRVAVNEGEKKFFQAWA